MDTVLLPADQMRKPGSCGKPAPGIEIALLDVDGNEVTGTGPDDAGEVFVLLKGAFDTYYKNDASYESNSRGDYHTVGDVAYWDDEGYLYICDRKTDMIISGGMNIYPAEIEAALEQHPEIYDVAVFGIPSEEWGESCTLPGRSPESSLSAEEIAAFARQHPGQRCPGRWTSWTSCSCPPARILQAPAPGALLGLPDRPGRIGATPVHGALVDVGLVVTKMLHRGGAMAANSRLTIAVHALAWMALAQRRGT